MSERGTLWGLSLALLASAGAQRLPAQVFGLREGLAHQHVTCLHEDRKGYLWIGTWEGLSRCDGRRFVNYGPGEGLPTGIVNAICEDAQGRLWVATNGAGVVRLLDAPEEREAVAAGGRFLVCPVDSMREANVVSSLWCDARDGSLWCVTEAGVYRGTPDSRGGCRFTALLPRAEQHFQGQVFRGGDDVPWIIARRALLRIEDGAVARVELPEAAGLGTWKAVLPDGEDAWLVAHDNALHRITSAAGAPWPPVIERLPLPQETRILALARGRDGALLLGTTRGIVPMPGTAASGDTNGAHAQPITRGNGLPDDAVTALCWTSDQSLWVGTDRGGLARIAPVAIVSYVPEGGGAPNLRRVVAGADQRIYATTADDGIYVVAGHRLERLAGSDVPPFRNVDMRFAGDARGDYWLGTDAGLWRCRGPNLELARAEKLGPGQGLPELFVFGEICPDADGRVWFGTKDGRLACIDARDPQHLGHEMHALPDSIGVRQPRSLQALRDGTVWFAPFVGLWRLRAGTLDEIGPGEGLPGPHLYPRAIYEDARGRLWVGTRFSGVAVSEAPARERPSFLLFSSRDGLASDTVWSIAEDARGRIYLGTGRGLSCLDVEARSVRHLGTAQGLAGDVAYHAVRDARQRLWIATSGGLSCLDPQVETPLPPPPRVYLTRVVAGGRELALPETGALAIGAADSGSSEPGIVLEPGRTDLWVECTAIGAEPSRFEHRLLGADVAWSAPGEQAALRFPRLSPGSYRLLVRARFGDGRVSEVPASLAFVVLAPVWTRPWFLGAAALLLLVGLWFVHRLRLMRALALERVRTEIATDLHDDLGSGLAQIAIQSEVGRRGAGPEQQRVLAEIALVARGLRESIADIVWAVDPRRDRLLELVRRARHVAFKLLDADGLEVGFRAPPDAETAGVELPGSLRRHLLLFVKEALTNVARHARARKVAIEVQLQGGELRVRIQDDGVGFDPGTAAEGHGLTSLRHRARSLGGRLDLRSQPGHGTVVELQVPLAGRHRTDMRLSPDPRSG